MIFMRAFCNTRSYFHMEKTVYPMNPLSDWIIYENCSHTTPSENPKKIRGVFFVVLKVI